MKINLVILGVLMPWWCAFAQGPENVLVLVNESSSDSQSIAKYYAAKRKLPAENLCRIRTTESDTISKAAFEREILQPTSAYLKSKKLQDRILYIVTTRGLPLVIEGTDGPSGDLASVDSKLALLYDYMIWGNRAPQGRVENPYFTPEFRSGDFRPFTRRDFGIYLVTRLTGPSAVDSVMLVDRALGAAAGGAYYFDLASSRRSTESEWLAQAGAALRDSGLSATVDATAKVLDDLAGVQGYASQGGPVPKIQWSSGSIANVLDKGSVSLASGFVESGVAGFIGYVSDPTTDGYVRPQILFPAYAAGYNLAEACYAAARYLGWRQVIVGDPLASPFGGKTAAQRESLAESFRTPIDNETGLPELFSRRRRQYIVGKYGTSGEAALFLAKAESAAAAGDYSAASAFVDRSLEQDSRVAETNLLKAELLERAGDFKGSFDRYKKALESGAGGRDLYEKLARIAFEKLGDPAQAEPYAAWLLREFGKTEPDLVAFYAEIRIREGKKDEAAALLNRLVKEQKSPPAFALAALGRMALEKGNLDLARDFLARAIEGAGAAPAPGFAGKVDKAELQKLLEQASAKPPQPAGSVTPAVPEAKGTSKYYSAQVVAKTPIPYPDHARNAGIEGTVVVELLIDEMGQLMKVDLISGDRALGNEVVKAVRNWKFEPRLENGRATASRLTIPVVFKLKKPQPNQ